MDKVEYSLELIKKYEPEKGYHLGFSGGKDSICILELAKMAGVKFKAYFYMTTLDPPDILRFIKTFYPEVIWLRPATSMFTLIEKKGLPIRQKRFCCKYLKEIHGSGEIVLDGVRAAESAKRKKRKEFEQHWTDKTKFFLHAIHDWTDADVWHFISNKKLMFPDIYLGCQNRVGCIACPMAPKKAARDMVTYPKFRAAFIKAITKAQTAGRMKMFVDAEEAIEWWISGLSVKQFRANKRQYKLDFNTPSDAVPA